MKIFYKHSIPLIVFSIMLLTLLAGLFNNNKTLDGSSLVGKTISLSLLQNIKGEEIHLNGITIIHIFTSHCAGCKKDKLLLSDMKLKDKHTILGLPWDEKIKSVEDCYTEVIKAKNSEFFAKLKIVKIPLTLVVNKKGKILYEFYGPLNRSVIENEIIPVVNRK